MLQRHFGNLKWLSIPAICRDSVGRTLWMLGVDFVNVLVTLVVKPGRD